ncbi:Alpha/beta hydrolase family protein [Halopseudomonas sabulinigri]|uniref:Alpha/beta hydrolase family protein n=1 Tax=Halopseudomonas sabulinigri TaxID=472181 RepID=A0A1H1PG66_9GAMM|nr:alpha/beta hydrolase [Halopseudomonas sabulinigri]SDS10005.1 Alpha/beta hydrolase family protein [Halopseudomonas sabulinigri]
MNSITAANAPTFSADQIFQQACRAFSRPRRIAASPAEQELLAQASHSVHRHADQEIQVWTLGSGPRVLLVHGWDSRGSHLAAFVEPLLRAGFAVTLFDLPAHGDSSGDHSSVVHASQALLSLTRELGDVQAVIAHSIGSAAALIAFQQGLQVKASVHLCGPSSLSAMVKLQARGFSLNPAQSEAFQRWVEDFIGQPTQSVDLPSLLDGLRHRALIMHDPEDKVVPAAASQDLHAAWPGSELVTLQGLGHRRVLTDTQVITRAVTHVSQQLVASTAP